MIGARGTDRETGDTLLVLGLTAANVTRLQHGEPMLLRHATHPFIPEGWTVTIIAGPDDRTLAAWLQSPDTKVTPYEEPS